MMKKKLRNIKNSVLFQLIILISILLMVVMTVLTGIISYTISRKTYENLSQRNTRYALLIAQKPEVASLLEIKDPEKKLPEIIGQLGSLVDASIVVMDTDSIRYAHSVNPSLVGGRFTGGDEADVFKGKVYTNIATGISGTTLRAFAPIYNKDQVIIGAVSVGSFMNNIQQSISEIKTPLMLTFILCLFLSLFGAAIMSSWIKQKVFGYEPYEIAILFEEQNAILNTIAAGILVVNKDGEISLINKSAAKILDMPDTAPQNQKIDDYFSQKEFLSVMESGVAQYDLEQTLQNGKTVAISRLPLMVRDQLIGLMIVFRDKTELNKLSEELMSAQQYTDTLRCQSHEFKNTLQVISGLIELGEYDSAVKYINKTTRIQNVYLKDIVNIIQEPVVSGLLLSKISLAGNYGVRFILDPGSSLTSLPVYIEETNLVTIIGNLINNAIEAAAQNEKVHKKMVSALVIQDKKGINITVKDNGIGMPAEVSKRLFQPNFSTKSANRGLGLYNVKKSLDLLDGTIRVTTSVNKGSSFYVFIPFKGGNLNEQNSNTDY